MTRLPTSLLFALACLGGLLIQPSAQATTASPAATARTQPGTALAPIATASDVTAPTAPPGFTVLEFGPGRITTKWGRSTDNVGVAGYYLYLDGSKVAATHSTVHTFATLPCGSTHKVGVAAYDAAGNVSARSTVTRKTHGCRPAETRSAPPPAAGYFTSKPVGSWSSLPSDTQCASRVHRSSWEPRSLNSRDNTTVPNAALVRAAFAARPLSSYSYDSRWNTWLLPRVDGNFIGTTDEIFQWAACKWGVPDNVLRAQAVRESSWYAYLTYRTGACVLYYSCGDLLTASTTASRTYCSFIAAYGYDYQRQFGAGKCPRTFGIIGVMDWQDPSWGQMPNNQNGTFPFNRDSTAFALDYEAANLRGCYEGWDKWLKSTGTGTYAAGDLWGCVGAWYSGDWHSSAANGYIGQVQGELSQHTWLQPSWPSDKPPCSPTLGCPRQATYP